MSAADILPPETYAAARPGYVRDVLALKRVRRVVLGAHVSLQFESRATVLFLIHEIVRAGGTWTAQCIEREIAEYVPLVPADGELRATLMLHGGGPGLCERLTAAPGSVVSLRIGERCIGAAQLVPPPEPRCPVHYLRFAVGADAAAALLDPAQDARAELRGPGEPSAVALPIATRSALAADLSPGW